MSKQTIILITGKAGMGKSHYAKSLLAKLPEGYDQLLVSFAKGVKDLSNDLSMEFLNTNVFDLEGENKETFRPILQAVGKVGRAIDPLFWVNEAKKKIKYSGYPVGIIDDCRFENELKAFDEFNVIKVRINKQSANKNVNEDESEIGLDHIPDDEFDILITEENSEDMLITKIVKLLEGFGK